MQIQDAMRSSTIHLILGLLTTAISGQPQVIVVMIPGAQNASLRAKVLVHLLLQSNKLISKEELKIAQSMTSSALSAITTSQLQGA